MLFRSIKEFLAKIEHKNVVIDEAKLKLNERKNHLKHKKVELNTILEETKKEEEILLLKSEKCKKDIEERLVLAYNRIRNNVKNGLAVVAVERGASGGSYFTIPPQIIMEIGSRKKIITLSKPEKKINELIKKIRKSLFDRDNVGLKIPYFLGFLIGMTADFISWISGKELPVSTIRVKKFSSTSQFHSSIDKDTQFERPYTLEQGLDETLEYEFKSNVANKVTFDTE